MVNNIIKKLGKIFLLIPFFTEKHLNSAKQIKVNKARKERMEKEERVCLKNKERTEGWKQAEPRWEYRSNNHRQLGPSSIVTWQHW